MWLSILLYSFFFFFAVLDFELRAAQAYAHSVQDRGLEGEGAHKKGAQGHDICDSLWRMGQHFRWRPQVQSTKVSKKSSLM
jgi:hypothetical protein